MSHTPSEGTEPNLVPILDMVFQLITFFMLVINFKGATLDLSINLPVLGSARPLDWDGTNEPLILNIDVEGNATVYGTTGSAEELVAREARLLRTKLKDEGQDADGPLDVPVIIRADRVVSFHFLNQIIKICQDNGFFQFQLSAMSREREQ
jgi:biopolymer transport protein ExbD